MIGEDVALDKLQVEKLGWKPELFQELVDVEKRHLLSESILQAKHADLLAGVVAYSLA